MGNLNTEVGFFYFLLILKKLRKRLITMAIT